MEASIIESALQRLKENKFTDQDLESIRQAFVDGHVFIGGNVLYSVIIVGNGNTVQLTPELLRQLAIANNLSLHQLPQPPADFVGREDELQHLLDDIKQAKGAIISSITGMAGIGKTTLALIAAHELVTKFPDAQFFIDLKGASKKPVTYLDAMKHIIRSFQPAEDLTSSTELELTGQYQSLLSDRKVLLFFDNARSAEQIKPLIPPASCCMFVTTRWHFAVPGLPHPLKLGVLNEDDAIQLLIKLCPRLKEQDAREIASLCGYLPLALRIAGSFLQINEDWSPAEYISQLSKKNGRLESLEDETIDLKTVFSQSYQTLSKEDRQYWSMLAIFPDSFLRDAAGTVWGLDDESAHRRASKYRRYSLLDFDPMSRRYRMHDLLRDFANTNLPPEQRETAHLNHLRHFHNTWITTEELYGKYGEQLIRGLTLFDNESIHIKTAFEWALKNVNTNQEVAKILARIPDSLNVIHFRIHPEERLKWFQASLIAAEVQEALPEQDLLLGNIGTTYDDLSAYREAIPYYERAIKLAQKIGKRSHEGFWMGNIGAAYTNLGDIPKALEYLEPALEIARESGDRRHECDCLNNIAKSYSILGDNRKALEYLTQALEITRKVGDRGKETIWLANIGAGNINLGNYRIAIEHLTQAFDISRELGDKRFEGIALGNLGIANTSLGRYPKAKEYLEKALKIAQEDGNRWDENNWTGYLGVMYSEKGEYDQAIKYLELALTIADEINDRESHSEWTGNLGVCHLGLGEYSDARVCLEQALEIAHELAAGEQEAQWHMQLGKLYLKTGETMRARENLDRALAIANDKGLRRIVGLTLFQFAQLCKSEQDMLSAMAYAGKARVIFDAIETPELKNVDQFIESLKE